jgi:GxxExxY protein
MSQRSGTQHKPTDPTAAGASKGMRLPSPLDEATEEVMSRTIGAAIAVHKALGPGFLESIYRSAMRVELKAEGLRFECERTVRLYYRGVELRGQRIDLVVENSIVVELKSVMRLDDIHRSQLVSYLRATRLRGGPLINFRVPALRLGLKRVVL